MLGALTIPPAEDEVARAAARISDGTLDEASVARWPRARLADGSRQHWCRATR